MSIYKSLPVVARAIADKLNINITVGGSDAYASMDGEKAVINIPYMENADDISEAILGYTVHEAAHIRYTDFDMTSSYIQQLQNTSIEVKDEFGKIHSSGKYNMDVLFRLFNIAEDLRIEYLIARTLPGASFYLKAVRSLVFRDDLTPCDNPATVFIDTMLLCGRMRYHGFDTYCDLRRNEFVSIFGQDLLDKSLDTLGLALMGDSTLVALETARKIYDLAIDAFDEQQEEDEPNEQDSQDQSSSDNDSNGSADTSEGSSDDSHSNGSHDNTSPEQGADPTMVHTSSGASAGSDDADSTNKCVPGSKDPFANANEADLSQAVKDISEQFNDRLKEVVSPSIRNSSVIPFRVSPAKNYATSDESVIRGIASSSGIRQSMHGLLQGMQHIRRTHRETGLKIDGRLLSTVLTGNGKVFKHKSKTIALNSAFTVLLDASGSMQGSIVEAEAAVISVLYALENIQGVSTSAFYFPYSDGKSVGSFKSRKQSLKQAISAHHFGISPSGSTPLQASLWPALIDLAVEKADQKILMVVTDGQPDGGISRDIVNMINTAKNEGFKILGIGFGQANQRLMNQLFGDTGAYVGNISQLRTKLFDITRRALQSR